VISTRAHPEDANATGEKRAGILEDVMPLDGQPLLAVDHRRFRDQTSDLAKTIITRRARSALVITYQTYILGAAFDVMELRVSQAAAGLEEGRLVV